MTDTVRVRLLRQVVDAIKRTPTEYLAAYIPVLEEFAVDGPAPLERHGAGKVAPPPE